MSDKTKAGYGFGGFGELPKPAAKSVEPTPVETTPIPRAEDAKTESQSAPAETPIPPTPTA